MPKNSYIFEFEEGKEQIVCDKKYNGVKRPKEISLKLTEQFNPQFEYFPPNGTHLIVIKTGQGKGKYRVLCKVEPGVRMYWCDMPSFLLFTYPLIPRIKNIQY